MVLRALSATALAFSISVAWRWKAIYCNQRMELSGFPRTKRSKSSADWGCRVGSIRAASSLESSFSALCFSRSLFCLVCFFVLKGNKTKEEGNDDWNSSDATRFDIRGVTCLIAWSLKAALKEAIDFLQKRYNLEQLTWLALSWSTLSTVT